MEETVTHKGIIGILLALAMTVSVFSGACDPAKNTHAADDYHTWSQKDDRWAGTSMGGSSVRESGCYITSIAMVAAASGARDTESFNPGVFAQQLNSIGAFSWDGGLASWASVNTVIPEVRIETANLSFSSGSREGKASEMKSWLDKGMYVICNVGGHWVYVDSISGSDIIMADPAKIETDLYSVYNDIYCYQVLSGKNPYGTVSGAEVTFTETTAFSEAATTTSAATAITSTTTSATAANAVTTTVSSSENTAVSTTAVESELAIDTALLTAPLSVIEKAVPANSETSQTTTAATTTTEAETSTSIASVLPTGEYYYSGTETSAVLSEMDSESTVVTTIKNGEIVFVTKTIGEFGCININGSDAWVKLSELTYAGEAKSLTAGDINGDGKSDTVDLALLNDYIRSCEELPEGVSILRRCEIEAADISNDGMIDNDDVMLFLMHICK